MRCQTKRAPTTRLPRHLARGLTKPVSTSETDLRRPERPRLRRHGCRVQPAGSARSHRHVRQSARAMPTLVDRASRRELDRAAVAQRDRCAVRLRWAGEPREAVGGEGMRGDGRVHALGTMRRVLGGVVHVPDHMPASRCDVYKRIFVYAGWPSANGSARIYGPSSRSHRHPWPFQRVSAQE